MSSPAPGPAPTPATPATTPPTSPIAARRLLATELRRLRGESGRTLDEIADHLECSPAKLSRVETGQVAARLQDVRELLQIYRADADTCQHLLALVRIAKQDHWSNQYTDAIPPATRELLALETTAAGIHTYHSHTIPDLLQTLDYAAALHSTQPGTSPELVAQRVAALQHRQQLLSQDNPPTLHAIIDESALRRPVHGPDLMDNQYHRLLHLAGRPRITIQVLPLAAGPLAYAATPITILTFPPATGQPTTAHTGSDDTATIHHDPDTVRRYQHNYQQLVDQALHPDPSTDLIQHTRVQQNSHGESA